MLGQNKTINKLDAIGLNTTMENSYIGSCKLAARYFIYTCKIKKTAPRLPWLSIAATILCQY